MTPLQVTTETTLTIRVHDIDANASIVITLEPGAGKLIPHLTDLVTQAITEA